MTQSITSFEHQRVVFISDLAPQAQSGNSELLSACEALS
jgi:hypothetical protein